MRAVETRREWQLQFTGQRPVTMNAHRQLTPFARARCDKRWREAFAWLAKQKRMSQVRAISVTAIPLHKDRRSPQDVAACAPAVKAAIDGLVDAGVIPDDTPQYVRSVTFKPPVVNGVDGLVLYVDEEAGE